MQKSQVQTEGAAEAPAAAAAGSADELLTVPEVALLLRTTQKGVRCMIERGKLAGVIRIGRRVLVRRDDLRHSLGLE